METEILVDGKTVRLRATAAVPRLYRIKFRRDIIQDLQVVDKALKAQDGAKEGEFSALPLEALELFESMAYIMAKHADPEGVPGSVEEWLDGFQTFSIYRIFPVIRALWEGNTESLNESKKKLEEAPTGR